MKIDKIGVAQTSAFLLITMGIFVNHENNQNRQVDNLRTQIFNTDSARYARVQKRADNMPLQIKTKMWENAYAEMQDSLKTIGNAQKNYFIGSQGVKIK